MAGFSVFQPTLGAALQWLPALGTQELDDMIHAVFPGPASIQEKRAHISIDFFEYSQQSGQNVKYYPVPVSFAPTTVPSPASSAGLYDSAYGSNFNVSPVSNMSPWSQSPATFTSSFDEPKTASRTTPSKKPSSSSSRQTTVDFANHPGMRIMTKDGRDVTNSASRGCKTKEQRDHAHLMRIIKACDACKRKKIRCDPSHRKRTASSSASQPESKPHKKAKKACRTESPPVPPIIFPASSIFETPEPPSSSSSFESSPENVDDIWTQFVLFDEEPVSFVDNFVTDDYSFFNEPQLQTPSSIDSSASPSQWFTPYTPAPPNPSPPVIISEVLSSDLVSPGVTSVDFTTDLQPDGPLVPYLNPGVPHGTNYTDFNLFSPPTDFFLDEEPLPAKKVMMSGRNRLPSPQPTAAFAHVDECYSSPSPAADDHKPRPTVADRDEYGCSTHATIICSPVDYGVHDSVQTTWTLANDGLPARGAQFLRQSRPSQREVLGSPTVTALHQSECGNAREIAPTPVSVSQGGPSQAFSAHAHRNDAESTMPSSAHSPSNAPTQSPTYDKSPSTYTAITRSTQSHAFIETQAPIRPHATPQPHAPCGNRVTQQFAINASAIATVTQPHTAGPTQQLIVQTKFSASPVPGERPEASVCSVDSDAWAPIAVLAAAIVATPPMQRLPAGRCQKTGRPTPFVMLFQLAVFGLVSSLLVLALQAQSLGRQVDTQVILNLTTIASMSCLALIRHSSKLPESTLRLVGMPTTIDNVKTKIQAVGQHIDGLRCAASRHLRALIPRLPSVATVKF